METIYYIGMSREAVSGENADRQKEDAGKAKRKETDRKQRAEAQDIALPAIRRLERLLPYGDGFLQIYFSLLPEESFGREALELPMLPEKSFGREALGLPLLPEKSFGRETSELPMLSEKNFGREALELPMLPGEGNRGKFESEEDGKKQKLIRRMRKVQAQKQPKGRIARWLTEAKNKKQLQERREKLLVLSQTIEKAQNLLYLYDNENVVYGKELSHLLKERHPKPIVLYAVCLKLAREKKKGKNEKVLTLSLPDDCGWLMEEDIIRLLTPYLSRINAVAFLCERTDCTERISDYLFEEYGILTSYESRPVKETVWIDFGEQKKRQLVRYAAENGIYHLNDEEVVKFLDTTVKNGYNTEVD